MRIHQAPLIAGTLLSFVSLIGTAGMSGCQPIASGGPGGSCADLSFDFVTAPTAVMGQHLYGTNGFPFTWGLTTATNYVQPMFFQYAPNEGVPGEYEAVSIRPDVSGLAFDLSGGPGPDDITSDRRASQAMFLLEYTLPETTCPAHVVWDAEVTLTLPNGVCMKEQRSDSSCSDTAEGLAQFELIVIEDPTGEMAILQDEPSPLLAALAQARDRPFDPEYGVRFTRTDRNRASKTWSLLGEFDALGGVKPRIFIGVFAQTGNGAAVCINECGPAIYGELLRGEAVLEITDGIIGVGMTRND